MTRCWGGRDHAPYPGTRNHGTCVRCGRRFEPPPTKDVERDPIAELGWTREAASVLQHMGLLDGHDVEAEAHALHAWAERRALPGPIVNLSGRNMIVDAMEEAVDGVSYGTWDLLKQQLGQDGSEDADADRIDAVQMVAAFMWAYVCGQRIRARRAAYRE